MKNEPKTAPPILTFLFLFLFVSADDESRKIRADYPVTKQTNRVYVIYGPLDEPSKANQGYRNNILFVVIITGVLGMDVGTSVYAGNMALDKIRSVIDKPVVAVSNSHIHGGHWLGDQVSKEANSKVNIMPIQTRFIRRRKGRQSSGFGSRGILAGLSAWPTWKCTTRHFSKKRNLGQIPGIFLYLQ